MKRVLMVADGLWNGGLERQLALLASSLPDSWSASVLSMEDGPYRPVLEGLGIDAAVVPRRFHYDFTPAARMWSAASRIRPDVVHSWGWMSTLAMIPYCRAHGVPLLDGVIRRGARPGRRSGGYTLGLRWSDAVVANSAAGLAAFGYAGSPIGHVVYNGFDPARLMAVPAPEPHDGTVALMAARMSSEKDWDLLVEAVRMLGADAGDWEFVGVGSGPGRHALLAQAGDLVRAGTLRFPEGGLEIMPLMAGADVGVLLTDPRVHAEGCSNSIMEYMACGLPVVCTDSGGNPELVEDGVTGLLVPPHDAEALVSALRTMRDDPARARAMGGEGRRRLERDFTVDAMVEGYVDVYDHLLSARGGAPLVIVIVVKPYVGFPNGTAATSRVTAYARGLVSAGEDVRVILLGPSEPDAATAVNTAVTGTYQGIPFEYTSVSTIKHPSLLRRRWRVVSSLLTARRRIRELAAGPGVDAVLLYSGQLSTARFFGRVSRSVGALYALDLAEMPYHDLAPGVQRDRRQERFGRRLIGGFDRVIAISRYLETYAKRHLRPGAQAIVVPILVDCDEYRPDEAPATAPRLVTYVGMLNERKDGVATLMRAFARVAPEFPDVDLRLVGDSDDARISNVPEFRRLAAELDVADRVEFTGQVARSEIPRHLAASSVLVLARPSSQQADAGFPTKLGEYLASGRPTIVTLTSDIAEYLRDGESAYLIPPGDEDALVANLRQVLADPGAAATVGAAGQRVAQERFDYRVSGRLLADALTGRRTATR